MSIQNKGTLLHAAVLGVSVAAAIGVWMRDKEPRALAMGDVVVWSGHASDVEKVTFEGKRRKVAIEAKKDALGRYFVGTLEREAPPPRPHAADAGAPPAPAKPTTIGFVSVGPGDKLAEALGTLKALRALGKVGDDRAAEFGLAEPEGTVTVTISGAERKLVVGGPTPGGGDRYVRLLSSGEVFVLKGEPLRNLESPDSLLLERELHEWKDAEVQKARVEAGGKSRDVVRGGAAGKRFWADAASPETNDETLGNWMSKLERLRPSEFLVTDPEAKETLLRVEYTGSKPLGFLEVIKVPGGDKPAYYLRTERTRLYGKVVASLAEQVQQDLGTIVK
jgi:hypothetical protein